MNKLESRVNLILDQNKERTGRYGPISFVGDVYQLMLTFPEDVFTPEERINIEKDLDTRLKQANKEFYIKELRAEAWEEYIKVQSWEKEDERD